jgi:hypothetical protein
VTASKNAAFAVLLSALSVADLRGQSRGRDLPPSFRSVAGVTLNQDSAATIFSKLGNTRERHVGAGNDAYISWCYAPAGGPPRALLELMSDATDRGTPGHALNVIRFRADASSADREGCAQLRASASFSTPAGLRLELGITQIQALLGPPTRRGADSLIYYFDAREDLRIDSPQYAIWNTPEHRETCFDAGLPYANVAAKITVVLRDGRAAEIRVERNDQSIC